MNINLVNEIRTLARTLEHWELVIEEATGANSPERSKRWQIGLEADITSALESIRTQFESLNKPAPKPKRKTATKKPKAKIRKTATKKRKTATKKPRTKLAR